MAKSSTRIKIDKQQTRTLAIVAVAAVVTVFSLMSTKALLAQASYHRRELSAKRNVLKELQDNVKKADTLKTQYDSFNSTNPNIIGGKNTTDPNAQPPDGDNARIVLDALPSTYDFPALVSSASKMIAAAHISNPSLSGSDQSAEVSSAASNNPAVVEIPLSFSGTSSYAGTASFIHDLERSIRPFDISTLDLNGNAASMTFSMATTTYFQPAKYLGTKGTTEVR